MMERIKAMKDEELGKVSGGKGPDDGAARRIEHECRSEICKGAKRWFDVYSGAQEICETCGARYNPLWDNK
ncbi:MAG: hypothetical protein K6G22_14190 [Lachnospiraceae bacterium]|nr:hypothetical protein [Lachnospiraceae bacterium]